MRPTSVPKSGWEIFTQRTLIVCPFLIGYSCIVPQPTHLGSVVSHFTKPPDLSSYTTIFPSYRKVTSHPLRIGKMRGFFSRVKLQRMLSPQIIIVSIHIPSFFPIHKAPHIKGIAMINRLKP